MSTEGLPDETEYGITEEDRRKMGELAEQTRRRGEKARVASHGLDGEAVSIALDRCPDAFTPAKLLVAAWLFETGSRTAREAADATGVSYATAKGALDAMVDHEIAHLNGSPRAEDIGPGRHPTVYVPAPDGLPAYLR